MVADLIYAQRQLDRAKTFCVERGARDCIDRAWDALERCIEAEKARADAEAAVDAELEAMFGDEACVCGGHKATCTCEYAVMARRQAEPVDVVTMTDAELAVETCYRR